MSDNYLVPFEREQEAIERACVDVGIIALLFKLNIMSAKKMYCGSGFWWTAAARGPASYPGEHYINRVIDVEGPNGDVYHRFIACCIETGVIGVA